MNFRDQKTLLGMNESAVRTENAVEAFPSLVAFSYALMQLAFTAPGYDGQQIHRLPKWRRKSPPQRLTTGMMISELRSRIWGLAVDGNNLSHFVYRQRTAAKLLKFQPDLRSAVLYAHR